MKLSRFWAIVFALCIFGNLTGAAWPEPEKILSTAAAPAVCMDNDGRPWVTAPTWVTHFDEGWQEPMKVELEEYVYQRRICVDKNDEVWVCGTDGFNVNYRRYDGEQWGELTYVPIFFCANWRVDMTADSSDGVWMAWNVDKWYYWQVVYNRYHDGAWDEPQLLTDAGQPIEHDFESITTDALGRVWIGWIDLYFEPPPVLALLKCKYFDGISWSDELTVTPDSTYRERFTLAPDREGGMWALWFMYYAGSMDSCILKINHWDGEEWSEPDSITKVGSFLNAVSTGDICVDFYGNAWAVWRQALVDNDGCGDIYYSVNSGSGWSEPAPVDDDPASDRYPDIAVDGEGRIWCVWTSTRGDEWGTWASYTTSAGVAEPATPVTHHLPSFTIDKSVGREFTFRVSSLDASEELLIYDAGGRVVRSLAVEGRTAAWDGKGQHEKSLPSGVYFVKLDSNPSEVRKVVLIR